MSSASRLPTHRPLVCLITARHGLASAGSSDAVTAARLAKQVASAIAAGVDLVQVREPDLTARELERLVRNLLSLAAGSATAILVNERADVALGCGAHGVHLKESSVPASRVRDIAPPGFLIGRSVHSAAQVRAAALTGEVDYVTFGTVFATTSKPAGHSTAGLAALGDAARGSGVPVLAVGGMSVDVLPAIAASGAAGVAAIRLFTGGREGGDDEAVRGAAAGVQAVRAVQWG